jgi:hypothetical protein
MMSGLTFGIQIVSLVGKPIVIYRDLILPLLFSNGFGVRKFITTTSSFGYF